MKSISLKLWAGMMLLVVVVLVLLWSFQIVFLENFYTGQRVAEVRNKGIEIAEDVDGLDSTELESRLDSFVYDYNCSIDLVDAKGNTVYSNEPGMRMPMMAHNNLRASLFREIMSGKIVTAPMTHPRFDSNYMVVGIPVVLDGQVAGALLINMPLAPVQDTAAILKKQLVYISAILFAAALLLSFVMSRSFIRPILEITGATDRMASGDFGVRLKSKSGDEIGRLSEAINHLGQELSKTEQLRRDFIANVSHELRTPLSLIRGYAETIRDVSGENKEKREGQLEIIIEESERLSRIVDDILHLSRMQSGNLVLDIAHFDLNHTIRDAIDKYEILSRQMDIGIIYSDTPSTIVKADQARIEQVLYNLINNAFNYSKPGGYITVSVRRKDKAARVEVSDTGEGIAAEDLKNIWERYYKGDGSDSKNTIGTGLGLAIVKSILESHNSKFGVESTVGKGTTFWFELNLDNIL